MKVLTKEMAGKLGFEKIEADVLSDNQKNNLINFILMFYFKWEDVLTIIDNNVGTDEESSILIECMLSTIFNFNEIEKLNFKILAKKLNLLQNSNNILKKKHSEKWIGESKNRKEQIDLYSALQAYLGCDIYGLEATQIQREKIEITENILPFKNEFLDRENFTLYGFSLSLYREKFFAEEELSKIAIIENKTFKIIAVIDLLDLEIKEDAY